MLKWNVLELGIIFYLRIENFPALSLQRVMWGDFIEIITITRQSRGYAENPRDTADF